MFIFRTTEGEKIHNKVHAATLAIAAIHKNTTAVRILYHQKIQLLPENNDTKRNVKIILKNTSKD